MRGNHPLDVLLFDMLEPATLGFDQVAYLAAPIDQGPEPLLLGAIGHMQAKPSLARA